MIIYILCIIYIIGILIASIHYRTLLETFVSYYIHGKEKYFYITSVCFWPLTYALFIIHYVYELPSNIIKNVEQRKDKLNK